MKLWLAVLALFTATALIAADGGTIRGTVKMPGRSNEDAVVYLADAPGLAKTPPSKPVEMDQKDLLFIPHVLPVVIGSTVRFLNNDDVLHNVYTPSAAGDKFNLGTWPRGETRDYTFKKLGEVVLLCNPHPDMEAWVVVTPTCHFGKSDKAGDFSIPNVPAGNYVIKVWHKRYRGPDQNVAVPAGGEVTVDFVLKR